MTVYVVEDDAGVSDSLLLLLRDMGHEAIAFPDAETFFRASPPGVEDTVFVDLVLPGISGTGIIRWLQNLRDPPRIIAMTGQSNQAIEWQLQGVTVTHLLRKPLDYRCIADLVTLSDA